VAGLGGAVLVWRAGQRAAAWLSLLAAALAVVAARVAGAWPAVPPDVPDRIVVLAAGFLVPPTAYGLWALLHRARVPVIGTATAVVLFVARGGAGRPGQPPARGAVDC